MKRVLFSNYVQIDANFSTHFSCEDYSYKYIYIYIISSNKRISSPSIPPRGGGTMWGVGLKYSGNLL